VRRQAGDSKASASPATKPRQHHPQSSSTVQRMKDLQALVGNTAVAKMLEKKPDPVSDPSVRETLMKVSHEMFERIIDRMPTLFGPAAQLVGTSALPGQNPGHLVAVQQMGASLILMLAELDTAIHQFEQAGGELTDIQPIVALRAQLSTGLYFLNLIQSGAPMGPQLLQCVQEAVLEGTKYRQQLALKKALQGSGQVEEGPRTQDKQQDIDAKVLQWRMLFLGEPGRYPSAQGLKAG
jgi:hypothetical protein